LYMRKKTDFLIFFRNGIALASASVDAHSLLLIKRTFKSLQFKDHPLLGKAL
jgi:hypothetical protein